MADKKVRNVHQRILAVMGDVDKVIKETKKVNNQYRFVSHDAVAKALHKPCVDHGLCVIPNILSTEQDGNTTTIFIEVDFVNADDPVDKVTVNSFGYGIDSSDKGPGKAYSYAFKMCLLKTFMLESDAEDNEVTDEKREPAGKEDTAKAKGNKYMNRTPSEGGI